MGMHDYDKLFSALASIKEVDMKTRSLLEQGEALANHPLLSKERKAEMLKEVSRLRKEVLKRGERLNEI